MRSAESGRAVQDEAEGESSRASLLKECRAKVARSGVTKNENNMTMRILSHLPGNSGSPNIEIMMSIY